MEYTELADYPLPSGYVTEWVPTARDDSFAPDSRPLSTNHISHLRCTSTELTERGESSWIGTVFRIDAPLRHREFAQALRRWIDRHEVYRTTPEPAESEFERRTLSTGHVELNVRHHGIRKGSNEIFRHIETFFGHTITPHSWPHLAAISIEPVHDASFYVVVGADHSVMDAFTQLLLITELRELYAAVLEDRESNLPPCGSHIDHSAAERAAATELTPAHPATEAWRKFWFDARGRIRENAFPLPLSSAETSAAGFQSSVSRWLLSADECAQFAAACKQHGIGVSNGTLTALAVALYRLSESAELRFVMPMHTRTGPEFFTAAGWFVGLVPVQIDLGSSSDFIGALSAVNAGIRRNQPLVAHSYPQITELLGVTTAPQFVVSFIDGRNLPGAADWTAEDRVLRSPVRNHDEVYIWVNRTTEGLNVSLRFPNNEIAAASLHALISEFSVVLREVAATGTAAVSPSQSLHSESATGVVENR
ncbi:MAG: condensation domain-containing protein [Gordonia sp. (in: high G+C Gram-positive bacteria)]